MIIALMLKRSRHLVLQSFFNYALKACKRRKHKASTYSTVYQTRIKSKILSILSPNPNDPARLTTLDQWLGGKTKVASVTGKKKILSVEKTTQCS